MAWSILVVCLLFILYGELSKSKSYVFSTLPSISHSTQCLADCQVILLILNHISVIWPYMLWVNDTIFLSFFFFFFFFGPLISKFSGNYFQAYRVVRLTLHAYLDSLYASSYVQKADHNVLVKRWLQAI